MISIAERLKPFSHMPGTRCLIPGSQYLVEAFPALIRIREFSGAISKEVVLDIEGPLKQFTLVQDLERGCVTLFSELYHFHLLPNLDLMFQKNPPLPPLRVQERLSLGSHKKQEWEAIKKRGDFREIFPLWFRLGSLLNLPPRQGDDRGVFSLLKPLQESLYTHRPERVLPYFEKLFLAGFSQMLVPRIVDEDFQGILSNQTPLSEDSPLYLLSEGSALIRSLFILTAQNEISILPNLPPEFFEGRMLHLSCPPYGKVDLEWSKKTIKRVHFHAVKDGQLTFHFPSGMRHFRVRSDEHERGRRYACGDSLEIKSGSHYLLDQFQK
jgi:hypothetical protein